MSLVNITQKFADSAPRPEKSAKKNEKNQYWDKKLTGLLLEVYKSGKGTYYYRYTGEDGKTHNHRLGYRSKLKVKEARSAVFFIAGRIAKDDYPDSREEKKEKQAVARKRSITIKDAYEEEYVQHIKAKMTSSSDTIGRFKNHLLPEIGNKKLLTIKRSEIEALLNNLGEEKRLCNSTLNRLRADLSSFFGYFLDHDDYPLPQNPVSKIKKYKELEKEYRELSDDEIKKLLKACKESSSKHLYNVVSLCMLTGARRNEVLSAKWEDFQLDSNCWVIVRNKQNKRDIKALSNVAVEFIRNIPKVDGSEYLFPQTQNLSKYTKDIHRPFASAKRAAGIKKDFTIHDFRHQFATQLARAGVDIALIQKLLGHSNMKTTMRYARIEHNMLLNAVNNFNEQLDRQQLFDESA